MKLFRIMFAVSAIFLLVTISYAAETINLVTYYPVPFGAYDRVKLVQRASNLASPCEVGTMYVDTGGQFQFCRNNGGVGTWTTITPNAGIWAQSSDDIYLTDTATNPNLFVGIGTTTPANRLDVEGSAAIGATYSGTTIGPANGLIVEGNVGLGTTTVVNKLDVEGAAAVGAGYSGTSAAPANGLLVQGNVGIGTTTVVNTLDIEGKAVIGAAYSGTSAASANGLLVEGNMGLGTITPMSKLDIEGGAAIGATYSGTTAAPANGLIVEGNVGVGTNSPARPLHVGGAIRLGTVVAPGTPAAGDIYSSGTSLYYYNGTTWKDMTASGGPWNTSGNDINNTNTGKVIVGNASPGDSLMLQVMNGKVSIGDTGDTGISGAGDGFLGIRTANPGHPLHIKGRSATYAVYIDTGGANGIYIKSGPTTGIRAYGSTNAGHFFGNVTVTGALSKGSGSFIQPHPTDPTKQIYYSFFEGRDNRVFFDGVSRLQKGKAVIEIPEDFRLVASKEKGQALNVILTPFGDAALYVQERSLDKIVVAAKENTDIEFGYFIIATRGGFEDSKPIQENTDFHPENAVDIKDFESRYIIEPTDKHYSRLSKELNKKILQANGILNFDGTVNRKLADKLGWTIRESTLVDKK